MAGPINWLNQVISVTRFGLMSLPQRLGSACVAFIGVAGVVAVLVGVLSIAAGFQNAMKASASPDATIILRSGADSEMVSGFEREITRIIADAPQIARGTDGPLSSAELFVIINLPKRSTGTDANVPLRGVEKAAFLVRDNVKMIAGRPFEWGKNEIVVGVGAQKEFSGLDLGGTLKMGTYEWQVVGVFTASGGTAESEIWTDAKVLQGAYKRGDTFQSIYARLGSANDFPKFKDSLTSDPRLNVQVQRQAEFYEKQSETVTTLVNTLGVIIAVLMAFGAIFGALNTMYSAVSARTREIATLRALGFGSGAVVVSVMLESLLLALGGGVCGAGTAYFLFNGFQTATMNWQSFSQVAFAFAVTPELLVQGIIWATSIGLVGGLFPAIRAARQPIAAALREL
jgi:putative ABC transport system permease protein